MGKQRTLEKLREEERSGATSDRVIEVFTEHYLLAKKRMMLPEAAIATGAAAAQNFVASVQQRLEQGQKDYARSEAARAREGGEAMR